MKTQTYLQWHVRIKLKLGNFLGPRNELVADVINTIIEDGASWREFDGLEFCRPPFGELNSVISQLLLLLLFLDKSRKNIEMVSREKVNSDKRRREKSNFQ